MAIGKVARKTTLDLAAGASLTRTLRIKVATQVAAMGSIALWETKPTDPTEPPGST